MKKAAVEKKPKLADLFKPTEIVPRPDTDLNGLYLVLSPSEMKPEYCTRKYLVWKVIGGNGAEPGKLGTGVFAVCVGDGEQAKWHRGQFTHQFVGDVEALKAE